MDLYSIFIGSMIVLAICMIRIFVIILLGELQLKKLRERDKELDRRIKILLGKKD